MSKSQKNVITNGKKQGNNLVKEDQSMKQPIKKQENSLTDIYDQNSGGEEHKKFNENDQFGNKNDNLSRQNGLNQNQYPTIEIKRAGKKKLTVNDSSPSKKYETNIKDRKGDKQLGSIKTITSITTIQMPEDVKYKPNTDHHAADKFNNLDPKLGLENNQRTNQPLSSMTQIKQPQQNLQTKTQQKAAKDSKKPPLQKKGDEDDDFDSNLIMDKAFKNEKKTGATGVQKNKQPLKLGQFKFNKIKPQKQNSIELLEDEYYSQLFKTVYPDYNSINSIAKYTTQNNQNNGIDLLEKETQAEKNFFLLEMKQLAMQMGMNQKELESQYELFQKMVITQIDDEIEKETDPFEQVVYFNNQELKTKNIHPFFNRYVTILEDFNRSASSKDNANEFEGYFNKKKIIAQVQLKQQYYSQNSGQMSQENSSMTRMSSSSQFNPNKNFHRKRTQQSSQSSMKMSINSSSKINIGTKKSNKKQLYNPPEFATITDQNCEMSQNIQIMLNKIFIFQFIFLKYSLDKMNQLLTDLQSIQDAKNENWKFNDFVLVTPQEQIKLLQQCQKYYEDCFGSNLEELQQIIQNNIGYWKIDPHEVAQEIVNLKIYDFEDLYWLSRAKKCIELPPDWIIVQNTKNKAINIHPCSLYIQALVKNQYDKLQRGDIINRTNNLKFHYKDQTNGIELIFQFSKSHFMIFQNHLNEEYSVDVNLIIADLLNNSHEKVKDLLQQKIQDSENSNSYKSVKEIIMERQQNTQLEIDQDRLSSSQKTTEENQQNLLKSKEKEEEDLDFGYYSNLKNKEAEQEHQKQQILSKNKRRKQIYQENLLDDHLLIICKEVDIQLPQEVHLLVLVSEYLLQIEKDPTKTNWRFRVNEESGEHYWINKEKNETTKIFPYKTDLEEVIDYYQKALDHESLRFKLKKGILTHVLQYLVQAEDDEVVIFDQLKKEAQNFVLHFISHYKKYQNIYEYDPILNHPQITYRHFMLEQEGVEFYKQVNLNKYLSGEKQLLEEDLKAQLLFWWPYQLKLKNYLNKEDSQKFKTTHGLLQDQKFLSNAFEKSEFDDIMDASVNLEPSSEEQSEEEESEEENAEESDLDEEENSSLKLDAKDLLSEETGSSESMEEFTPIKSFHQQQQQKNSAQDQSFGLGSPLNNQQNDSSELIWKNPQLDAENSQEGQSPFIKRINSHLEENSEVISAGQSEMSNDIGDILGSADTVLKKQKSNKKQKLNILSKFKNKGSILNSSKILAQQAPAQTKKSPFGMKKQSILAKAVETITKQNKTKNDKMDQSQNNSNKSPPLIPIQSNAIINKFKKISLNAYKAKFQNQGDQSPQNDQKIENFINTVNSIDTKEDQLKDITSKAFSIELQSTEPLSTNQPPQPIVEKRRAMNLNIEQSIAGLIGSEIYEKLKTELNSSEKNKNPTTQEKEQIESNIEQIANAVNDNAEKINKKMKKKKKQLLQNKPEKLALGQIFRKYNGNIRKNRIKEKEELERQKVLMELNFMKTDGKDNEKKPIKKIKKRVVENSSEEDPDDRLSESDFLSQESTDRDYFKSSQIWEEEYQDIKPDIQKKDPHSQKKEKKLPREEKIKQQIFQKTQLAMKKKKQQITNFNYQDYFMREINENYLYKQDLKKMRADIREQRKFKIRELFDMMKSEYLQLKEQHKQAKTIQDFQYIPDNKPDSFLSQFESITNKNIILFFYFILISLSNHYYFVRLLIQTKYNNIVKLMVIFLINKIEYYLQKREMFQGVSDKLDSLLLITSSQKERISIPKPAAVQNNLNRLNILHNVHQDNRVKVYKLSSNEKKSITSKVFPSTSPNFRNTTTNNNSNNILMKQNSLNSTDFNTNDDAINKCLKPTLQPLSSRPVTSQTTRPCTARSVSPKNSSKRKVIDAQQKAQKQTIQYTRNEEYSNVDLIERRVQNFIHNVNCKQYNYEDLTDEQRRIQKFNEEKYNPMQKKVVRKIPTPHFDKPILTLQNIQQQQQNQFAIHSPKTLDYSIQRDLISRIRINKILESICDQKSDYFKIDLKNGTASRNYYKLAALEQLTDLKYSLIEEKLNQLILEFIMHTCKNIIPEQKNAFVESTELKIRFYFKFQDIFHRIKLFLYSLSSIQSFKDYFYAFLKRKTKLIYKIINVKFGEEIQDKINNKMKEIFPKLLDEQVQYAEEFQNSYDYHASPFTHNPFKISFKMAEHDFFIDSIKIYYENKYQKEITRLENEKRFIWRKEKLQQIIDKRKMQKILDDEMKIQERENESESDDEQEEKEIKMLENMTLEQLNFKYLLEKYESDEIPYSRKKEVQISVFENPQLVIKNLSRFVENQEKVNYLKRNHRMFNILSYEIGQIHKVHRNYVLKYEAFINKYVTPQHVNRLSIKLKINNNPALYWISYLYCVFILRYSQEFTSNTKISQNISFHQINQQQYNNNSDQNVDQINQNEDFLNYFIEYENDYDLYFQVLGEFQSIKADILMEFISQKQQQEYLEVINWYQFLDDQQPLELQEDSIKLQDLHKEPMEIKPKEQLFFLEEIRFNPKMYFYNSYTKKIIQEIPKSVIEIRNKYLNSERLLLSDIVFQISELIHAKH